MKALAKWSGTNAEATNRADLLLRYFQSTVFDSWIALQYLFQNTQPGVHDYLCNRLHELGEEAIEKYLLQLVYLAISKPGHPLEQTIVNLCQKSFRVAIKEVPIRNPKLDPLSPLNSQFISPPFSPVLSPGSSLLYAHAGDLQAAQQRLYEIHSVEELVRPVVTHPPGRMVMSPPGGSLAGAQLRSCAEDVAPAVSRRKSGALQIDLGCLLPGEQRMRVPSLGAAAVSAAASTLAERIQSIRRELGEGEGVTALLERSKQQGTGYVAATEEFSDDEFNNRPMSPLSRLRYDTFGATLDFVDALCDASSSLASYSQVRHDKWLRSASLRLFMS
ncbi:hypothetical protein GPECTOR_39g484 [Gonium pectorale]|uniref:PI4KB/PIK1 accessory domain-containing protein n=1 Tax=Gonium pectorale TaxID=33097 RepID=A0A150GCD2_GONPE|nr:hypothetical protein GPECTOR_39g484 [Gonium pectorale]|eukprot:KXZ46990.1 hypothetical protein GPECTOR_39g484 [Gonium pectorale]